jgi:hypothetical protein
MADLATPSAAAIATAEPDAAVSGVEDKSKTERPEKPDEDKYKKDLAAAEKAHTESQAKYVSLVIFSSQLQTCLTYLLPSECHQGKARCAKGTHEELASCPETKGAPC